MGGHLQRMRVQVGYCPPPTLSKLGNVYNTGCSQQSRPLVVIAYIAAPNITNMEHGVFAKSNRRGFFWEGPLR